MGKTLTIALIALVAAVSVHADTVVWANNCDGITFADDPQGDADIYPADFGYGEVGRINYNTVAEWTGKLALLGHQNGNPYAAVQKIAAADLLGQTDGTFTFDLVDMANHADTRLIVEIWEAKTVTQPWYAHIAGDLGVDTWGDAFTNELAVAEYANADEAQTHSIGFTRTDTDADLVVFIAGKKTVTWGNVSQVDNLEVSVIPEPATMSLFGLVGGAMLFFRRKFDDV